jgi:hypothetical protein
MVVSGIISIIIGDIKFNVIWIRDYWKYGFDVI